ncbi:MAG: hypothetical protein ACKOL0_01140, partial [Solirubrobacterales bacterium]
MSEDVERDRRVRGIEEKRGGILPVAGFFAAALGLALLVLGPSTALAANPSNKAERDLRSTERLASEKVLSEEKLVEQRLLRDIAQLEKD